MKLSTNNFLTAIKNLVTGGGRLADGSPKTGSGFLKRAEGVSLSSMLPYASLAATAGALTAGSSAVIVDSTTVDASAGGTGETTNLTNIPADSLLLGVYAVVDTSFDGDTTTTLEVGVSGNADNYIDTSDFDPSGVAGTDYSNIGGTNNDQKTAEWIDDATQLIATWTNTANMTAGAVTVRVVYVPFAGTDLSTEFTALLADAAELRKAQAGFTADETNALVYKVEEAVDTVGTVRWAVPRDYDEATDILTVRVLASQLTQSTDDDVTLDASVYVKTAGSALGADLNPTAPTTVLSTTEQWVEFDLKGNSLTRDDVVYFTLKTGGQNDTNGEEVLIHDIEFVYRSCLVSYDSEDSSGNSLR